MTESASVDTLIGELRDFRTRSRAINGLVDKGDDAVDPLIGVLNESRDDRLQWCAARILGEIGNQKAVEPLREAMQHNNLSGIAAQALERLTGTSATDLQLEASPLASSENRHTDEELLTSLKEQLDATVTPQGDYFEVFLPSKGDEPAETVAVRFPAASDRPLVTVTAETGIKSEPRVYEQVLKWNTQFSYGAIGLAKIESNLEFVLVDTQRRETLDPLEIVKAVRGVAHYAGRVRQKLSEVVDSVGT